MDLDFQTTNQEFDEMMDLITGGVSDRLQGKRETVLRILGHFQIALDT